MPSAGILLALLAIGQGGDKELVTLPLSEEGVKPPAGLDAWKVITQELKRSAKLGMSMALQKKQHDFLIGPAREQARDCGTNVECLAEIGVALKADVLVAGSVDDSGVSLIAIDVKSSKRIGGARSNRKLAKAALKRKARSAARVLIEVIGRSVPAVAAKTPEPRSPPPPPVESAPAPPPAEPEAPAPAVAEGEIHIPKEQLSSVSEVKIDGEILLFGGDGSMTWKGAPGSHSLVAVRADGSRITKDVMVDPAKRTEVVLEFPVAAVPTESPPPAPPEPEPEENVLTTWWFWTSIGAAVAAGATTAALLAGGAKGGPDIQGETGTIRGSY
jgi:hypothetical protein